MSSLRHGFDRRAPAVEELLRRHFEAFGDRLDPDPLFRRRLRSHVLNRFVAAREGLTAMPDQRQPGMGKLGRASLYALVGLAMSVTSAMAASQAALPGDVLYPVKRQIEALRMELLPSHYHDDLAMWALSERVNELGRLAEAGHWERAAAMAGPIGEAYADLIELTGGEQEIRGPLARRIEVLVGLLTQLPPQAQAAIERALDRAPGLVRESASPAGGEGRGSDTGSRGPGTESGPPARGGNSGNAPDGEGKSETSGSRASASPKPSTQSRPSPSPTPEPSTAPASPDQKDESADSSD